MRLWRRSLEVKLKNLPSGALPSDDGEWDSGIGLEISTLVALCAVGGDTEH